MRIFTKSFCKREELLLYGFEKEVSHRKVFRLLLFKEIQDHLVDCGTFPMIL